MGDHVLLIGHIYFWILGGAIIMLPLRWAIPCYLLVALIDSSGADLASASTLGVENSLKVVLLPTLLMLRIGWKKYRVLSWPPLTKSWLLFFSYVVLAALWSPFQLSAIKMIGYLYSYSVLFLVFSHAWLEGWIDEKVLSVIVFVSLASAAVQTYLLGDLFGYSDGENRFTTFSDTESFAAFLIALISLFLFSSQLEGRFRRIVCIVSLVIGVILTGSRYVFLGLIVMFLAASAIHALRGARKIRLGILLRRVSMGLAAAILLIGLVTQVFPQNRLNQLTSLYKPQGVEDIGTFGFRLAMYQVVFEQLADRDVREWIFGTGTSSGANAALKFNSDLYKFDTVDGNRIVHNEFLRAFYEWGAVGLLLFILFIGQLFKCCLDLLRRSRTQGAMAFLAIFPTLLIGLAVGNVLAEAGLPGGTGYVFVLACAAASRFRPITGQEGEMRGAAPQALLGGMA